MSQFETQFAAVALQQIEDEKQQAGGSAMFTGVYNSIRPLHTVVFNIKLPPFFFFTAAKLLAVYYMLNLF